MLGKGLASGQVGERSEGGEGVADAQEEVAVTKTPKILTVVVGAPGGAGKDVAGGKFQQDGVDCAVHVVFGFIGQTLEKVAGTEGEQEVLIVDVVDGQHGAASEEELLGERLEAELVQGKTLVGNGPASGEEGRSERKKKNAHERESAAERRNERPGNHHGSSRVSLLTRTLGCNAFTDARATPMYADDQMQIMTGA
jgi:hypothetical protein